MEQFKRARGLKGQCEVCYKWVRAGEYYITTGTDGHGALTGLTHKDCVKMIASGLSIQEVKAVKDGEMREGDCLICGQWWPPNGPHVVPMYIPWLGEAHFFCIDPDNYDKPIVADPEPLPSPARWAD